jgi:hypothetical protein
MINVRVIEFSRLNTGPRLIKRANFPRGSRYTNFLRHGQGTGKPCGHRGANPV